MDWLHSSFNKDLYPNFEPSLFKSNDSSVNDANGSQFMIAQLKQAYQERIQSLENQVKEIYREIDQDQILQTMGLSQISKDFRRQRIQEIAEDSLLTEKEIQIEKLIQVNVCLKRELYNADIEIKEIKQNAFKEVTGTDSKMNELVNELRNESGMRNEAQEENNVLHAQLKHLRQEYDRVVAQKETKLNMTEQSYKENLERLSHELERLERENRNLEQSSLMRGRVEDELKRDLELIRNQYVQVENSYNELRSENNNLKRMLNDKQQNYEAYSASENEINSLKLALKTSEDELKTTRDKLKLALRDNTDLLSKSEYISIQARKVIEQEHLAFNEKVDEVKNKYKPKIEKYKSKVEEFESLNHSLSDEVQTLKYSLEDNKKQRSRIETQLSEEVKQLKSRSEKREKELELNNQKLLTDLKSQYQQQIENLKSECQQLLEKLHVSEAKNLNLNTSMTKGRGIDSETRLQFEGRLSQLERDYILKTKHENILSLELWNLQTSHKQEIQALKENFDQEMERKVKAIQENEFYKNDDILREMTEKKRILEDEIKQTKNENQQLLSIREEQTKKIRGLKEELEKLSINHKREIMENQSKTGESLTKAQSLYEGQMKKNQELEEEHKESLKKNEELEKQRIELLNHNKRIKQELEELLELQSSVREEINQREVKNKTTIEESKELKRKIETINKEKDDLERRLLDFQEEFKKKVQGAQREITMYREEGENKDTMIVNLRGTNEKLENSIRELNRQEKELRADLSSSESNYRNIHTKMTNQALDFNLKISEIGKFVGAQIERMKKEVYNTKKSAKIELDMGSKVIKENTSNLIKYYKEYITFFKTQKTKEDINNSEKHSKEVEDLKKKNETLAKENNELSEEVEKLNKHVVSTFDTLEEAKLVIREYESQLKKLKSDNSELKESNIQRGEKIKEFQIFIEREMFKIRDQVHRTIPEIIKIIESHYKAEIAKVVRDLDSFKDDRIIKLKQVRSYIVELQDTHQESLEDSRQRYSENTRRFTSQLTESQMQCENEKNKVKDLKDELKRVKVNYYNVDNENKTLINDYDKKFKEIGEMIRAEKNDTSFEKNQSLKEKDRMRKELRDLRKELEIREEEVRSLKAIRIDQQECIIKYRNLLDRKQKDQENFDHKVFSQSAKSKEIDIDDLEGFKGRSSLRFANRNSPF